MYFSPPAEALKVPNDSDVAKRRTRLAGPSIEPSIPVHLQSTFIWSVADLLRGDYKQSDYGKALFGANANL